MNEMIPYMILMVLCVITYVASSLVIVNDLKGRGVKINWFFIRLLIIKYANQYKELTRKETGSVGRTYYYWIGSAVMMLVVAALIMFTVWTQG